MNYKLNTDYIVIGNILIDEEILLKNIKSNRIFKMSPIEYEIIKKFTLTNSIEDTLAFFSKDFNLTEETIQNILSHGKNYKFIVLEDEETEIKDYVSTKFSYVFIWIYTNLKLYKLNIKFDMMSNFNLIKLLSWNTVVFSKKYLRFYIISFYFLSIIFGLTFFILLYDDFDIYYVLYNIGEVKPLVLIVISLPLSLLISFLHEFSHFITYKYFGGKQNEMGLALMYRFLPVFYTTTEDMVLWKNSKKRILVAFAGLINDFVFVFSLLIVHSYLENGILSSVISFLIFSLLIKFFYNTNPFAPGSDMYFILSDFINYESPFIKGHQMIKSLLGNNKEKIKFSLLIFGLLCYLSIFLYVITFLTLITLPFWIDKII